MTTEQLDLFDLLPPEPKPWELPAPVLFASSARGPQERNAEFHAWCEEHNHFDSIHRSHAWVCWDTHRWRGRDLADELPPRCLPTALTADLGCKHWRAHCECVGGPAPLDRHVSRGACFGCDWEGPARASSAEAIEDAHDHAWPGWRDLPTVPRRPESGTSKKQLADMARWEDLVNAAYPDGWLTSGGPIVTVREGLGTRDVPNATGHGGYDLCARPFHTRPVDLTDQEPAR